MVLTIGGGFAGVVVSLGTVSDSFRQSLLEGLLNVVVVLYFIYAIVIGIRLAEDRASRRSLFWLYGVQVPVLSGPVIAYHLGLGAHVSVVALVGGSFDLSWWFGGQYNISIHDGDPLWGVGVNFVALGMYLITRRAMPSNNRWRGP